MKNIVWFATLLLGFSPLAPAAEIKTAFVKNNEIFVLTAGSPARQVTHDGIPKFLPVWSRDGSKIAFNRVTDPKRALSELVVVDEEGVPMATIPVRPVESAPPAGMRYVERLEWLSPQRIAIGGTQNIDLTETLILDLASAKEIGNIVDNGGGPAFSSDGSHSAYLVGMPHFSPHDSWRPTLNIDDAPVFPKPGEHTVFVGRPQWSPVSNTVAILVQDYATKQTNIVLWRSPGVLTVVSVDSGASLKMDLFWNQGDLYLTSETHTMRLQDNILVPVPAGSATDSGQLARSEKREQDALVREVGGDPDADSWCASCALATQPRRKALNE